MFNKTIQASFLAFSALSSYAFAYEGEHHIKIMDSQRYLVVSDRDLDHLRQGMEGTKAYKTTLWSFKSVPGQEAVEGHQLIAKGRCLELRNGHEPILAPCTTPATAAQTLRLKRVTAGLTNGEDTYWIKVTHKHLCLAGDISGNGSSTSSSSSGSSSSSSSSGGSSSSSSGGVANGSRRLFKVMQCDSSSLAQQFNLPPIFSGTSSSSSGSSGSPVTVGCNGPTGGFSTAIPPEKCFDATSDQARKVAVLLAMDLMGKYHLSPEQMAGILGNLMHESGLNSNINQGGRCGQPNSSLTPNYSAYGWAQWDAGNKTEFVRFANSHGLNPASPAANYLFLTFEWDTKPFAKEALNAVRSTNSIQEAARQFMLKYESPLDPQLGSRLDYANKAYQWLKEPGATLTCSHSTGSSSGNGSSSGGSGGSSSGSGSSSSGGSSSSSSGSSSGATTYPPDGTGGWGDLDLKIGKDKIVAYLSDIKAAAALNGIDWHELAAIILQEGRGFTADMMKAAGGLAQIGPEEIKALKNGISPLNGDVKIKPHPELLAGNDTDYTSPHNQIYGAAAYLAFLKDVSGGSMNSAIQRYNGGNDPSYMSKHAQALVILKSFNLE